MAGLNVPVQTPSMGRRIGGAAVRSPRVLMSWEDWLTAIAAAICFIAIGYSIQQANWVARMPAVIPTALAGLVIGLVAARIRFPVIGIHLVAVILGLGIVVMAGTSYADGVGFAERLADFRIRMQEWWLIVIANDISNDNLPFVTLVHSITFLATYVGAWAIFRWHNAWLAIVPGGIVLLANISFERGQPSGAFIIFLFGAIILIARLHLQKSQARWRRTGVDYPEFISLTSLQVTIWLALALIIGAWMVPLGKQANAVESVVDAIVEPATERSETLTRLFHNIDSRKGANLHNFGSVLPIQGSISLGTKQVLEVQSGQAGLIRGTSYDEYTGTGWKSSDRDTTRVDAKELAETEDTTSYLKRVVTILRVKVVTAESTILTLGTPLTTTVDSLVDTPEGYAGDVERIRSRRALGAEDTYNSFGSESRATAEELIAAGSEYPGWVNDRYLQLPKNLPGTVLAETDRILAEAGTAEADPYTKAAAIEAYLRTFPYDLDVAAAPPGRDAVDFLLNDLKRGYFDYQASAMAVMLRAEGIPARIAVGYTLNPERAVDTTYVVRKDDAYAWVEVFFPQYGWIPFNPTSDQDAGGAGGLGASGEGVADPQLELGFLEETLLGEVGLEEAALLETALSEPAVINEGPLIPRWVYFVLAGILGMVAMGYLGGRLAWNWGMGGLEGRVRLWAKTQRVASWAGLGSHKDETPREWSNRLGTSIGRETEAKSLATAYEEARYGRPDSHQVPDAEAESAYKRLRTTLVRMVLRRQRPGETG